MKRINIPVIVDFLRRIIESDSLDNVRIKDEYYNKSIEYCSSGDSYIWIYIGENKVTYTDINITKDIEFNDDEEHDLLYFFNKIFNEKEEKAFNALDKLCRYKTRGI